VNIRSYQSPKAEQFEELRSDNILKQKK